MDINKLINADQYRVYGSKGKISRLKLLITNPAFKYIYILRKSSYYKNKNKIFYVIFRLLLSKYSIKYGIEISPKNKIGKGFYIGHIGGIVFNSMVEIGDNVNILKGVLIGYNPRGESKGSPKIGNNVWIGPNAVIVGNINVGDNVVIAPNSFINKDIPSNSVVFGNPVQIKTNKDATKEYINFKS